MGGAVPGGVAGGLTEIFQEGLRVPFVKLYRKGKEDRKIFEFIGRNIRIPEKTLEDFRAQAATTIGGARRVKQLVAKYGLNIYFECAEMLLDYAEDMVRRAFRAMPNGDYTGVDYVDDDGFSDEPVKVQVNVHKRGDEMYVDFKGTSSQTKGNINCPWSCTKGGVFYTIVGIVDPYMTVNSGTFRPIHVESEEGLVTRPRPPAGVTARSQVMTKITEAMLKAMSQVVPNRVVAGSHGQACTCSFNGIHPETGKRFSYIEIQGGGLVRDLIRMDRTVRIFFLSIRLPESGGYGDPLDRDSKLVRWDVINGKISLESAREHYGVVFNPDTTVNEEETGGAT
jgi:N-methylhydantoinase B